MKKDINQFLHNVEKWSNILNISAGIQTQDLKSIFDSFSTLWWQGLNCIFQEFFKGIISIIFCKTLTLRNVETWINSLPSYFARKTISSTHMSNSKHSQFLVLIVTNHVVKVFSIVNLTSGWQHPPSLFGLLD